MKILSSFKFNMITAQGKFNATDQRLVQLINTNSHGMAQLHSWKIAFKNIVKEIHYLPEQNVNNITTITSISSKTNTNLNEKHI